MHRIDGPGHAEGQFTEGNPTTGTPATVVTDDWLNAIQEEIAGVIEAAGIDLDKADNTQLEAALAARFGEAVKLTGDQAITGHKTFNGPVSVQEPTAAAHPARKADIDALSEKIPTKGYIFGMTPSCASEGSTLKVAPGAVEQGGKVYELEAEIDKTASLNTGGALGWKCIYLSSTPAEGNILEASHIGTDGLSLVTRSAVDGLFYRNGTQRVIGLYPTCGGVVKRFYSFGGRYHLYEPWTILDDPTPATSGTDINVCYPALGVPLKGCIHVRTTISGATEATGFQLNLNGHNVARIQFPYSNNCNSYYSTHFEVPDWGGDSTVGYYVSAIHGSFSDFRLLLDCVDIPTGLAR